jgi:acyl transferase domain-containing protein
MCSSSLYSIHLAAQSVLNGDCDMAIAAGSNVISNPASYVMLNKLGVLSPEFICRAFDEGAKGYVRGEGCGAVLVKPLSKAQRDGDNIIGVIRASAIKHNGAGRNIAAPSVPGQMIVIQQALDRAQLLPADIDLLEAHATGTKAGDKKELETINTMYTKDARERGPIIVGAVKSMYGHSEGASGITEFIKALLSIHYRFAPPNINFTKLRPDVAVDETKVYLSDGVDLSGRKLPLRAGVNSFGAGGTNAHIIIESYGHKGDVFSQTLGKEGPYQRKMLTLNSQRNDFYVPKEMQDFIAKSADLQKKRGLERRASVEELRRNSAGNIVSAK